MIKVSAGTLRPHLTSVSAEAFQRLQMFNIYYPSFYLQINERNSCGALSPNRLAKAAWAQFTLSEIGRFYARDDKAVWTYLTSETFKLTGVKMGRIALCERLTNLSRNP